MKLKSSFLILFSLLINSNKLYSQVTASDCVDAINACTNPNFIVQPSGFGAVNEFGTGTISNPSTNPSSSNSGCLLAGELNSTWIIVNVVSTGVLEFSMGDGSSPGCMDWIMWPYDANTCSAIFNNTLPPVSCNWNGACLGYTGLANTVPTGASPFDFEPGLNVNAGDQFIICFSNYSGQQNLVVPINSFGTAQISCYNTVFICPGESIQLTGFAGAAGSTYNWTPNGGIQGSSTSQTVTVSPSAPTVYQCVTTQPNGTLLDTMIQVSLHTPPTFTSSVTLETCAGANDGSIQITPSGNGPFTYTINGTANASTTFTGVGAGNYLIEVTDANGCVGSANVTVGPGPICCFMTVSASFVASSCPGACDATATANFIDNANPPTFNWLDNTGASIGQTTQTATGLCVGTYTVEITDPNLCTLTASVTITAGSSISINSISSTDPICYNDCNGTITINSPSATMFSIDNGLTFSPTNTFTNLCSGNYLIEVRNGVGCTGTSSVDLINPNEVIANFIATPEVTTVENPLVNFINLSTNNIINNWDFGGIGNSSEISPSYVFPSNEPGIYNVCLTVANNNNCEDSICQAITINDGLIYYIPNAFSPDGDGINDIFIPILNNFDENTYELLIFNRWGELIFQSTTISEGWDGSYTKGPVNEKVKNDVYIWKLAGNDKDTRKKIELIGHVTVIK